MFRSFVILKGKKEKKTEYKFVVVRDVIFSLTILTSASSIAVLSNTTSYYLCAKPSLQREARGPHFSDIMRIQKRKQKQISTSSVGLEENNRLCPHSRLVILLTVIVSEGENSWVHHYRNPRPVMAIILIILQTL